LLHIAEFVKFHWGQRPHFMIFTGKKAAKILRRNSPFEKSASGFTPSAMPDLA